MSLNVEGVTILKDEYLHLWYTEPDVFMKASGRLENEEPLLVNLMNTWAMRPEAITEIPNFFLASDYVRTYTDLATIEGANEAARRAVNGIIDAASSNTQKCQIWALDDPPLFAPWREIDRVRYHQGLPWDNTLVSLGLSALDTVLNGLNNIEQDLATGLGGAAPAESRANPIASLGTQSVQEGMDSVANGLPKQELITVLERHIQAIIRRAAETQSTALTDQLSSLSIPPLLADGAAPIPNADKRIRSGRVRIIPQ